MLLTLFSLGILVLVFLGMFGVSGVVVLTLLEGVLFVIAAAAMAAADLLKERYKKIVAIIPVTFFLLAAFTYTLYLQGGWRHGGPWFSFQVGLSPPRSLSQCTSVEKRFPLAKTMYA